MWLVPNGAILFIRPAFSLSTTQVELVVSAVLIGATIGAIASARLTDTLGRRLVLLVRGTLVHSRSDWLGTCAERSGAGRSAGARRTGDRERRAIRVVRRDAGALRVDSRSGVRRSRAGGIVYGRCVRWRWHPATHASAARPGRFHARVPARARHSRPRGVHGRGAVRPVFERPRPVAMKDARQDLPLDQPRQ